jgi:uncharacterized Tic20 family protein
MIIIEEKDRVICMLCHLSALCGVVVPIIGNLVVPLAIWLLNKDKSEVIDNQGKESLNFQITLVIGVVVSIPLCFVLIGFLLIGLLYVFGIISVIIASVKTYDGVQYKYPIALRLIK